MQASRIRARHLIAVFALTAAAVSPAAGQGQAAPRDEPIAPFSAFYFTTGTLLMDVSKLNPRFERLDLEAKDRPGFYTISNDGFSVGIGGYGAVVQRLLLGAEVHSADVGLESSPQGKTNHLETNYWMGTLGYAIVTTWRVNITPTLGIGTGKVNLTLKSRDGGPTVPDDRDPTFDEVIMSPGSQSVMKGSYVTVQPGLAIDLLILRSELDRLGLTLGIRMASAISPNRTTWTYKGREVFGGPDVGPTAGTVRIIAGIGGFRLMGSPKR